MSSSDTPPAHYAVLGVPLTATAAEVTRRFRQLSLELHPDRVGRSGGNGAAGKTEAAQLLYQRVVEAYAVLSDPVRRAAYDARSGVNFASRVHALRDAMKRNEASTSHLNKLQQPDFAGDAECKEVTGEPTNMKMEGHSTTADEGDSCDDEYTPC